MKYTNDPSKDEEIQLTFFMNANRLLLCGLESQNFFFFFFFFIEHKLYTKYTFIQNTHRGKYNPSKKIKHTLGGGVT